MYGTGIIDLRQISENDWKAKYQGNYGIYIIKITTYGKKTKSFSCTCPSDNYPCKHISMIEKAIAEKISNEEKPEKGEKLRIEDFIGSVSAEKLREFIIAQTKYNTDLYNAVLLEFSVNTGNGKGNKYSKIIKKSLASIPDYGDDDYLDESLDIDVLDQWYDKANDYISKKQYNEALLICKACIEEYSQWLYDADENVSSYYSSDYQFSFFELIIGAVDYINKKELFNYCLSEMKKKKYAETEFYNEFHRLLEILAVTVDPDAFIALQDELLAGIKDKSSYEAESILRRKINIYRRIDQKSKAWALIRDNIQIESFRLKVVKKKIEKLKFKTAKKLINDFLDNQKEDQKNYFDERWNGLLLDIAQKEKDVSVIKKLSYMFIKDYFEENYYQIYKAAFTSLEWKEEKEKLILHYSNKKYFSSSAADLLVAEKETERLLKYIEQYPSIHELEKYYKTLIPDFPEKTLELFKKVIVSYAANNVGRTHYEKIHSLLMKISRIKGGKIIASKLVNEFKVQYKNRKAMMEILAKWK